jgi:hypothetical protein
LLSLATIGLERGNITYENMTYSAYNILPNKCHSYISHHAIINNSNMDI